jgi:hypothetical protein
VGGEQEWGDCSAHVPYCSFGESVAGFRAALFCAGDAPDDLSGPLARRSTTCHSPPSAIPLPRVPERLASRTRVAPVARRVSPLRPPVPSAQALRENTPWPSHTSSVYTAVTQIVGIQDTASNPGAAPSPPIHRTNSHTAQYNVDDGKNA